MKRAALALALVASASSVASAKGFVGIGIGTNAVSEGEDRLSEDGRSARFFGGARFGRFTVEGMLSGFDLAIADRSGAAILDAYQLSAAGRYNFPLGYEFEVFGRGGLQHTWASGEIALYDVAGTGFLLGAGFEYRIHTGIGSGSLFVDYQLNLAKLSGDRFTFDATTRQWTLGLTVGF